MATSIMACLRTSRCIFVSPFILGTKSWHLHECRHCVCCMKLTKRSVQLAFDPAHRVFFRKKLKNLFASEIERKGISQYESEVTRTLPAVQKGIFERTCVRIFGEGRIERRVSVEIRHGGDRGQIRSTRRIWGCVWGFSNQLFVFLLGRHLSVVSIHSTFFAFGHGVSRSWILS